jgi:hypothetical protein
MRAHALAAEQERLAARGLGGRAGWSGPDGAGLMERALSSPGTKARGTAGTAGRGLWGSSYTV